jgi:hypothetical protein
LFAEYDDPSLVIRSTTWAGGSDGGMIGAGGTGTPPSGEWRKHPGDSNQHGGYARI